MNAAKLCLYLPVLVLGGCVPLFSLHRLYTEKDLVFDEKLLGTWSKETNDANNTQTWQFKSHPKKQNAYILIISQHSKDNSFKGSFDAHLVKLDNHLFIDLYPNKPAWADNEADIPKLPWAYNAFFAVPTHTFLKLDAIDPNLELCITDDDNFKKLIARDPNAVEYDTIDDKPLLTAPTEQLQAFVCEYADDTDLFSNRVTLERIGPAEPNTANKNNPTKKPECTNND